MVVLTIYQKTNVNGCVYNISKNYSAVDELSLPCSSSSESFWAVASDSSQNSFVQSTCAMNKLTIRIRSSRSCCGLDCTINVCNENEQNDNKNQLGGLLKKCKNINTPKFIANTKETHTIRIS